MMFESEVKSEKYRENYHAIQDAPFVGGGFNCQRVGLMEGRPVNGGPKRSIATLQVLAK